jgi:nifR3 family TIM-barrel protein
MVNFWLKLPKPFLVLAPMEEVTDFVFREVFLTLPHPDVFFTEFTSADGLVYDKHERTMQKLKYSEEQRPIVAQIWGNNPENFFKAAQIVQKLGFDGVDINMGCPERLVVKRGCGAGLIGNPTLAAEIIRAVKEGADNLPVSVKTRIGINNVVTESWTGFLLQQKLAALTVHARTAKQMSAVPADWTQTQLAVQLKNEIAPETIIIGNGDINNYAEAVVACQKFGTDGAMIARGVFSNPWAFERTMTLQNHTKVEYLSVLSKHLALFEMTWGRGKNYHIMKKFFKMYIREFDGASEMRQALMETNNRDEAEKVIAMHLAN